MKIKGSDDLPELTPDEDRLLELLVAYEQALADGTLSPDAPETLVDLTAQQLDQLARGKHLLDLLALLSQDSQKGSVSSPPTSPAVEASPAGASELDWLNVLADGALPQRQLGRFLIVRELGVGAHGVVLLAFDPVLKRHVALKVPRGEALVSTSLRRRFLREARAAARLTHPNLVSVYEVGEAGPLCYIASAFCAGPSVATWLRDRGGRLPPRQAAQLVAQLAAAMHYAHSQGVLHRDIKPSNILLEPLRDQSPAERYEGTATGLPFVPKLADFGLAKVEGAISSDTKSGLAMGTPGYMSPEQAEGRVADIGPATDVYGLGTVLYETLTGKRPFVGSSDADCLRRVVSEEPTRPRALNSAVPPDLEAICLKCLEKRPSQRYGSAQELAADLERFLAGEPICARRVTRGERLLRWARRNPGIATLSALVFALLTVLAVGSLLAALRIDKARQQEQVARRQAEQTAESERMARSEAERSRRVAEAARSSEHTSREEAQRAAEVAAEFAERARGESATAQSVANFLEGMFRSVDPIGLEGYRFHARVERTSELTAAELLDQGIEQLSVDLADQPAVCAKLMAVLGSVYVTLGRLREAEPLLEQSLQIRQGLFGEDSLEMAESQHDLAILRFANFDFSAAKQLLHKALAIRTATLGATHPDTIRTKFNLAWLIVTNGHEVPAAKAQAVPLMEEVLDFYRDHRESPTQYVFALLGLAMLRFDAQNKPLEAAALVAEADRLLRDNGDSDLAASLALLMRSRFTARDGESPCRREVGRGGARAHAQSYRRIAPGADLAAVRMGRSPDRHW